MGRGNGFLAKVTQNPRMTVAGLLEVLEGVRVEPSTFFAWTFDIRPEPESFLRDIQLPEEESRPFSRVRRAAKKIEFDDPPEPPSVPIAHARLDELTRSSRSDQRKRLRKTKKFQTPRFLREYLVYLDDLRYDRPSDAELLARTVAHRVLPLVAASREERLELFCGAVGVFASANRLMGELTTASRAVLLGLELARRYGFEDLVAALLHRGSYVLHDYGQYHRALALLEAAQTIYFDADEAVSLGTVLVSRGVMWTELGENTKAVDAYRRALQLLPTSDELPERWRLSAYHGIAVAQRQAGDTEAAERWLEKTLDRPETQAGFIAGKLVWLHGSVLLDKGEYAKAEESLLRALRMLNARESPLDAALISLEVVTAFLMQGKAKKAINLVKQMPALLSRFKGNKIAVGAILELIRGGLGGELSLDLVTETAKTLKEGAPAAGRAPKKSAPRLDKRSGL